jgi:hypothetical protein
MTGLSEPLKLSISLHSLYGHDFIPEWRKSIITFFLKGQFLLVLKLNEDGTEMVLVFTFYHSEIERSRDISTAFKID